MFPVHKVFRGGYSLFKGWGLDVSIKEGVACVEGFVPVFSLKPEAFLGGSLH